MRGERSASRRAGRTVLVVVILAALRLILGAHVAAAAPLPSLPVPTPTLPSLPIATPPLPTPPLPTVSLPVPSLPLPLPSVTVGVPPVTTAGVPPLLPPPASAPPGGATQSPGDSAGAGSAQPVDTSVLGALLALLGTPAGVGVERPSLEHFDVSAVLAAGRVAPPAASNSRGGGPLAPVLFGLAVAVLLALLGVAVSRHQRRRLSRLRVAASASLLALTGLMTVAAAQSTWFAATPSGSSATTVVGHAGGRAAPTEVGARSPGSILFNRLVSYETQVAQTETQLQSPAAGEGAALLRDERALAVSLEATLQREYDFYAQTAQDPAQAAALLQAAASRSAAIRNAVTYDVEAVQAQLAQQAAVTRAAAQNETLSPDTGTPLATPSSSASTLTWPMAGVITQGFGPSEIAIEPAVTLAGITYPHFHTGIDIASTLGTPVRAAADGVVALAGAETDGLGHLVGYGNYVVVAHANNMITLYGHLEQVLVHPGQAVHVGDPIGLEGSTGNSTGPHVHFELRIHGVPTNPAPYVRPS